MYLNSKITSSCCIYNNTVLKDGNVVFKQQAAIASDFLLSVYQGFQFNYHRFYKMDTLSKLCWVATEVLLMNSFDKTAYKPKDVGVVLCNANSSLDSDLRYIRSVADIASPALFVYTLPNIMIAEISIRNDFKGEGAFFVTEKFDPSLIKNYVNGLMISNGLSCCVCGWVDVLEDNYKAVLFLVEKRESEGGWVFSESSMDSIFESSKL